MSTASVIAEVKTERNRQRTSEGFRNSHDDMHARGSLALAGAAYALFAAGSYKNKPPTWWPWGVTWWNPGTVRRALVKAAALIVAEIERLDRAGKGAAS